MFSQPKQQGCQLHFPGSMGTFNIKQLFLSEDQKGRTHLGFSKEELQVSATQNAVVLHIAGNVHSAGTVHGAMDLHIVVDGVQVFLFILKQKQRKRQLLKFKEQLFNKDGQLQKSQN